MTHLLPPHPTRVYVERLHMNACPYRLMNSWDGEGVECLCSFALHCKSLWRFIWHKNVTKKIRFVSWFSRIYHNCAFPATQWLIVPDSLCDRFLNVEFGKSLPITAACRGFSRTNLISRTAAVSEPKPGAGPAHPRLEEYLKSLFLCAQFGLISDFHIDKSLT